MDNPIDELQKTFAAIDARHKPALRSNLEAERSAASQNANAQDDQAAERTLLLLRSWITEVESHKRATREARAAVREEQRLARARALLAGLFDPQVSGSLANLIASWRTEPSRAGTVKLQKLWSELDARCRAEIGDPIGEHILVGIFVDQIVAEGARLTNLCWPENSQISHRCVQATYDWSRAADVGAALDALANLERDLLTTSRQAAGPVTAVHLELQQIRKSCATQRDFVRAVNDFIGREKARVQAEAEKNYVAPAPPRLHRGAINDGFVSALDPDTTRGLPHAAADGGGLLNRARGWIGG